MHWSDVFSGYVIDHSAVGGRVFFAVCFISDSDLSQTIKTSSYTLHFACNLFHLTEVTVWIKQWLIAQQWKDKILKIGVNISPVVKCWTFTGMLHDGDTLSDLESYGFIQFNYFQFFISKYFLHESYRNSQINIKGHELL